MAGTVRADESWSISQKKTFSKWVTSQMLAEEGARPVDDLLNFFSDGTQLIILLKRLFPDVNVPRHNRSPKNRVHALDNCTVALEMLERCGIDVPFLKPANLVDGEEKMVMGLVWALIMECQIKSALLTDAVRTETFRRGPNVNIAQLKDDVASERLSQFTTLAGAKNALLQWVQERTDHYPGVDVQDFDKSFADGLAFAALVDAVAPGVVDMDAVRKADSPNRHYLAFTAAANNLGIYPLLEVDDMVSSPMRADNKSVMTYVSEFLKYWNKDEQRLHRDLADEFAKMSARESASAADSSPLRVLQSAAPPDRASSSVVTQELHGSVPPGHSDSLVFLSAAEQARPEPVHLQSAPPYVSSQPQQFQRATPLAYHESSLPGGFAPVNMGQPRAAAQPYWVQPPPRVIETTYSRSIVNHHNPYGMMTQTAMQPMFVQPSVIMTTVPAPQPIQRQTSVTVVNTRQGRSHRQPSVITTGGTGGGVTVVGTGGGYGDYRNTNVVSAGGYAMTTGGVHGGYSSSSRDLQSASQPKNLQKTKKPKKGMKFNGSAASESSIVALDDTEGFQKNGGKGKLSKGNSMVASTPRVDVVPVANPLQPGVPPSRPLPPGFAAKFDNSGRVYYVDHNSQRTSYHHPMEPVPQHMLPPGWSVQLDATQRPYYINHASRSTTFVPPIKW